MRKDDKVNFKKKRIFDKDGWELKTNYTNKFYSERDCGVDDLMKKLCDNLNSKYLKDMEP